MNDITGNTFILPTPEGAYQCADKCGPENAQKILQWMMSFKVSPRLDISALSDHLKITPQAVEVLIRQMQTLNWLQALEAPVGVMDGKLEDILPTILEPLSNSGKALLADSQGFYISSSGFPHETAEELSALSADLASLSERHVGLLKGNLNMNRPNWALADSSGFSQLGFWPLQIGDELFSLIINGLPRFDHHDFLNLIWTLHMRYASPSVPGAIKIPSA